MDSQQGTVDAAGAHCITIEEPSALTEGEGKNGESEETEMKMGVNGESVETEIEMDVNTNEVMDNQDDNSYGVPIEERSLLEKMNCILTSKLPTTNEEATIFRAPLSIRESNKNMFEPSVISIGPYHRGRPQFKAMEEKKWSFLQDFLDREGCALEDCISNIKQVEKRARCCYSEPFDMSSDDFVEMMVLDGCFIIEFFYKYLVTRDFEAITRGWNSSFVETDMILLENQIPFFIIETLQGSLSNAYDLADVADILTRGVIPFNASLEEPEKIHHLLHLCLCYVGPTVSTQNAASEQNHQVHHHAFLNWIRAVPVFKYFLSEKEEELDESLMVFEIPCAAELEEAGLKFKKLNSYDDITKITFQSGTLVIPRLLISDDVKPVFMNLVALEQCMPSLMPPHHFSTYITFLDKLVNTAQDVKILQRNGILVSMLSSEEDVGLFFNQSGVGVFIPENHYLAELFKRVNKYCDVRYHRYRARLRRDYFNSPWSIIALIAATLLLCLTIIQSFMSVYSFIHPPS